MAKKKVKRKPVSSIEVPTQNQSQPEVKRIIFGNLLNGK